MPNINFILQGKGGVGKSFIALNYAQYLQSKGKNPLCVDTDPVNNTLLGFGELKATRIEILKGDEINSRQFDVLVETAVNSNDDVIVDNGASSFVPLSTYLITNEIASILTEASHKVVIHTVVTGGQSLYDTLGGMNSLVSQFPASVPFVIWLNPFFGPIEADGKGFSEMKAYKDNKARISGIVQIPAFKAETFGKDIELMLKAKQTYAQAQNSKTANIVEKQRLKIYQREMYKAIEAGTVAV